MRRSQIIPVLSYALALTLGADPLLWAQGQDFDRIAPKPVPTTPPPSPAVPAAPEAPAPEDDTTVLTPKLNGLVFLPKPEAVRKSGLSTKGIVFSNVTVPSQPDLVAVATPYLGRPLTRGDLNKLIAEIIVYFRDHDRPIVDVIVPEQEITSGTVQVVLLEGKVGTISVTGNRWYSSGEIADGVTLQPGDTISASQIQENLDWINTNPFRSSDLVYHPGEKLGETNLVLQTQDRFPARFYAGYEDSGNATTGFDRYEAGLNYGDLFGIGQQINYQYTTSGDGQSLRAHAGSYVIPLPWHNTLTFFGSYVDTKGDIPPLVGLVGTSYQISGRYTIPLPTFALGQDLKYKHSFAAGFDYKYNNNSLEFGNVVALGSLYDVDQFVMSYNGALTDPYGQLTINDQLYVSPGNWGGNNNDTAFNTAHGGATSNYVYNTLVLERLTKLPEDFALVLRGTIQTSNANLAPSEQMGFGGYDTVRGYDEREVNTDEGYIFTTELRTPPVSLGDTFGWAAFKDQLQFLSFWDYGAGYNHILLPGERDETTLSSIGFGVRYSINTYLTLRYDYGLQLLRTGLDTDHGSRSDLGLVVSY